MISREKSNAIKQMEADVIIIGGGIAGLSAATAAAWSGQSVLLVERSDTLGGTALHANGSIWIPNNHLAQAKGINHAAEDELRFILSECWPEFSETSPQYGIDRHVYERTQRYIIQGENVIRDLENSGVQKFTQLDSIFKAFFFSKADSETAASDALSRKETPLDPDLVSQSATQSWDYKWDNPRNLVPFGKHIWAALDIRATGKFFGKGLKAHWRHILGNIASVKGFASLMDQLSKLPTKFWGLGHGVILAERFRRHLEKTGVRVCLRHECVELEVSGQRVESVLLRASDADETIRCTVKNAVIFSSGCFSRSLIRAPRENGQPVRSTCVAATSDGAAFDLFENLDIQFDKTPKPLLAQSIFQLSAQAHGLSQEPVFFLYGDSFFVVDRNGQRIMNEKLNYHDRASHHLNDPDREFLFLIGDRRFRDRNWGFGISLPFDSALLVEGENFAELGQKAEDIFRQQGVDFNLADGFAQTARQTLEQFNQFAAQGHDPDFGRGDDAYDVLGFPKPDRDHTGPSRTMEPLKGEKLYLCIYNLSAFTTHGGLVCDRNSKVLTRQGDPWENLYAAGAFAASFLNGHYPAHGLSIGNGVVFGYLAGLHATGNENRLEIPDKSAS